MCAQSTPLDLCAIDNSEKVVLDASQNAVKSVTIFQSGTAEVTRVFQVDLKSGENAIRIENISSRIDGESPRIYNLGPEAHVSSICCDQRSAQLASHKPHKYVKASKLIQLKRDRYEARKAAREADSKVLNDFARTHSEKTPGDYESFMEIFRKRKDDLVDEILECAQGIASCDEALLKLRSYHKDDAATNIMATVHAKHECKVDLQLTYLVSGASWAPCYDLCATSSDGQACPSVTLSYCANISQTTGEDWNEAHVTLSTARSHTTTALTVPKPEPVSIAVKSALIQPAADRDTPNKRSYPITFGSGEGPRAAGRPVFLGPPRGAGAGAGGGQGDPSGRSRSPARLLAAARKQLLEPVSEDAVTDDDDENENEAAAAAAAGVGVAADLVVVPSLLDRSAVAVAYRLEDPVTVALQSDGMPYRFRIAELALPAELRYVCVPRRTAGVFVEGTVKNTSEYELLAGPARVFMDGRFVTKTSLNYVNVNESFVCPLGVDAALKVSVEMRLRTVHDAARSYGEPTKTTTRTATVTVANGHGFDVAGLVVHDAIPMGNEESNIEVVLRKPESLTPAREGEDVHVAGEPGQGVTARWTKAEDGKGGEKDGMYEWECAVPAGEKVSLVTEWDVKAPSNIQWVEEQRGRKVSFVWR